MKKLWVLILFGVGWAEAGPPPFDSPTLAHATSWVGNSYPGTPRWVQQDIRAMAVTADGTVFTNVEWEEGGGNVGEYRDGELIRYAWHTHGWGAGGGRSVAVNARYLFIGMAMGNEGGGLKDESTWPSKGLKWLGVSRRWRSDIARPAPFAGGKGGQGDTLEESFLVVAEVPDEGGIPLAGIVATDTELFVSDPNAGIIKVFDCETMAPVRGWRVERAGPLAIDRRGNVTMLEAPLPDRSQRVLVFDRSGKPARQFTLPEGTIASAIGCQEDRLLVADISTRQQILIYEPGLDSGELELVGTFGERGGVFGARGVFGDRRFNDVRALGCDAKGNLYVAQDGQTGGGGTVLESYALGSGRLNWRLFGLTFVDLADADPASDTDIYTKEEHFQLDYDQSGGLEWSYRGTTVDRFKYPQDPRLHLWSAGAWVRRIGTQRVLFVNDMNGEYLQVYRFAPATDGEIAIPSGFWAKGPLADPRQPDWPPHQPKSGEWIWRDVNGNGAFDAGECLQPESAPGSDPEAGIPNAPTAQGWWVDAHGNVWRATETQGIRYFPQQGLDAKGNPVWDFNRSRSYAPPPEFRQIKRLRYLPDSDTLFLAGTTEEHRNQHWKPGGPVLACYDGWLQGERKLRWQTVAPYAIGAEGHSSCEPMGFDVAGDFLFVPYTGASRPDGVKHGRVEVFRADDGSSVGHLEPSDDVGEIGLQDIRECLVAHRRANGEYIVFLEDDYKSKVVLYRLKPGSLK